MYPTSRTPPPPPRQPTRRQSVSAPRRQGPPNPSVSAPTNNRSTPARRMSVTGPARAQRPVPMGPPQGTTSSYGPPVPTARRPSISSGGFQAPSNPASYSSPYPAPLQRRPPAMSQPSTTPAERSPVRPQTPGGEGRLSRQSSSNSLFQMPMRRNTQASDGQSSGDSLFQRPLQRRQTGSSRPSSERRESFTQSPSGSRELAPAPLNIPFRPAPSNSAGPTSMRPFERQSSRSARNEGERPYGENKRRDSTPNIRVNTLGVPPAKDERRSADAIPPDAELVIPHSRHIKSPYARQYVDPGPNNDPSWARDMMDKVHRTETGRIGERDLNGSPFDRRGTLKPIDHHGAHVVPVLPPKDRHMGERSQFMSPRDVERAFDRSYPPPYGNGQGTDYYQYQSPNTSSRINKHTGNMELYTSRDRPEAVYSHERRHGTDIAHGRLNPNLSAAEADAVGEGGAYLSQDRETEDRMRMELDGNRRGQYTRRVYQDTDMPKREDMIGRPY